MTYKTAKSHQGSKSSDSTNEYFLSKFSTSSLSKTQLFPATIINKIESLYKQYGSEMERSKIADFELN